MTGSSFSGLGRSCYSGARVSARQTRPSRETRVLTSDLPPARYRAVCGLYGQGPWGGTYRGPDEVTRFFAVLGDYVEDGRIEIEMWRLRATLASKASVPNTVDG